MRKRWRSRNSRKKKKNKTCGGQGYVVNKTCKDELILVSCSVFGSLLADGSYARRPCFRLLEKWNFRRLSGYELAGNEIFLRHGSSGDWGS